MLFQQLIDSGSEAAERFGLIFEPDPAGLPRIERKTRHLLGYLIDGALLALSRRVENHQRDRQNGRSD
jgi:hypothetical protein